MNPYRMKYFEDIEAVIYDMDGLLVNSEPHWQQAEIEIFKTVGMHLTIEDCIQTTGIPTKKVFEYWYKKSPWQGKTVDQMENEIIDKMKIILAEKATPMPGVMETLSFFKSKGYKIAIASASPKILIETSLKKLGIINTVDFFHSGVEEKNNKPAPDIYWTAAKNLGVDIKKCLILEDSINGVKGAVASGAKVVAVPDPHFFDYQEYEMADLKIENLHQLLNYF